MGIPTINQRVTAAIAEEFELDSAQITPDARLIEDLGLDSLDSVDLIAALEREFKVKCPEAEARNLRTVGEIFEFVAQLQPA
ncbi:MAG: acyl carrier protein [Planctomycetota bacterium]|nr:MAG: acyl carrier protein [Planctomycetota bacterium]